MQSQQSEKIFFGFILQNPTYFTFITDRFFDSEDYKLLLPIVKDFHSRYHQAPSRHQVWQVIQINEQLSSKINEDKLAVIYDFDISSYDPVWLQETFEAWVEFKNLELSLFDTIQYVKTTKVSTDNVKSVVNKVKSMMVERNSIDFSFDEGLDFFDTANHFEEQGTYFSSGHNFIDQVLGGGFYRKALFIIAANPKSGKSLWLCDLAAQAVKDGTNVIYYTFELSEKKVQARIGSNLLNIPMRDYYRIAQDKTMLKNRMAALEMENMKTPGKLFIKEFPTGSISIQDLESHCNRLEERTGCEFPLIIIDYINIVQNWRNPNSENTYLKIKQISEDLRGWMVRKNKCAVSATQTNRGAIGSTDFTTSAIAESAGLAHTVDGLFGLIQDEIMYANREYFLKLLLNRNEGYKNVKKRFTVNYDYMKIAEDLDSQMIETAV